MMKVLKEVKIWLEARVVNWFDWWNATIVDCLFVYARCVCVCVCYFILWSIYILYSTSVGMSIDHMKQNKMRQHLRNLFTMYGNVGSCDKCRANRRGATLNVIRMQCKWCANGTCSRFVVMYTSVSNAIATSGNWTQCKGLAKSCKYKALRIWM